MDTIVALSSGRPPAAIGVLRVSGPDAIAALRRLAGDVPPARRASLRTLRDADGAVLDRALVLVFPGPSTATGEDLVELHCHGGRAVIEAIEEALLALPGLRHAAPGEFTRRALENGSIDLAEAEGLADLLAAETQWQRRAAVDAADGRLSLLVRGWMDTLSLLAARVEVGIDYADEDVAIDERALTADIANMVADWQTIVGEPPIERFRDGVRVVLAGPPNSGKSTLINALAQRDVAMVSPIAGTTRDRLEAPVMRAGVSFVLVDTAGLGEPTDALDAAGMVRAREALALADIVLWLGDDAAPAGAIAVHARADIPGRELAPDGRLATSAMTGSGVAALWEQIDVRARGLLPSLDAPALNARQRGLLAQSLMELADAPTNDLLLLAEHLRRAQRPLAEILGVNATEAMLDALFGRFCLGK